MANTGHNEGFHVLDDFVCEAIHDPSIPLANPANQGRNEGMSVVDEVVTDVTAGTEKPTEKEDEKHSQAHPSSLDKAQKRQRAEAWVKGYAASAASSAAVAAWLPGASAEAFSPLVVTTCYEIGKIYRDSWSMTEASSLAATIDSKAVDGRLAGSEGAGSPQVVVALGVLSSAADLAIKHFEDNP